jgi:hypothetical protein
MPSAADFNNAGTATTLCSNDGVLVQEANIHPALTPTPFGAATQLALNEANHRLQFTLATFPMTRTSVLVTLHNAAQAGSLPLFFLPWLPDHATTMTLPNAAGPSIFMTSTLTGCSVQVTGPANTPTITHANARTTYGDGYKRMTDWLSGQNLTAQQIQDGAEVRANVIATGKINTMLPPAGGALCKTVRKVDYAAKVDQGRIITAQRRLIGTLAPNEALGDFEIDKSNSVKPEVGAFVYGLRDGGGNWTFWYQTYVGAKFTIQDKFGGAADQRWPTETIPLGAPEQFFP